ncbi:MAG: transcription-repair coupling factor [Desulfuromonadales bacterium]|nr:transcription-repair coupling factor [Desulfuromonadales bacterium]
MSDTDSRSDARHATCRSIIEGTLEHKRLEIHGLAGSAEAHLLAGLIKQSKRPLAILVADQKQAHQLRADLSFYSGSSDTIALFPQWEVGPYDPLSPHPEVEAERLATLASLHTGRLQAVIITIRALMQRVMPRSILNELCLSLQPDQSYSRQQLTENLLCLGYQPVPLVEDRGTFSFRGDILDIFPTASVAPVRLDFFGDELEQIRHFDPASQRSYDETCLDILLLPARELVLAGKHRQFFLDRLRERCDELNMTRSRRDALLEEIREGLLAPGREFLLPFNFPQLSTLFDYLPDFRWILSAPAEIEQAADQFAAEIRTAEERISRSDAPFAPAATLFIAPQAIFSAIESAPRLDLTRLQLFHLGADWPLFHVTAEGHSNLLGESTTGAGLDLLAQKIEVWQQQGWRLLLVCHQIGQAERLQEMLEHHGLKLAIDAGLRLESLEKGGAGICVGDLSGGFSLPDEHLAVITEEEIFGTRVRRRSRRENKDVLLPSLAQLKEGDCVVHTDYGIGRYRGLKHLKTGRVEGDFLYLEYAGEDRLYLPIDRIERVQKYVGAEGHEPKLDKMGGNAWEKAKIKARSAVEEMARDLLKIQARRTMHPGFAYPPADTDFREFEASFPYEETDDQLAAIEDVLNDLHSDKPMDRLVCGDVGYGKTEVAIRAAYKVAMAGRQVALLVPTTILGRQHFETLQRRFRGTPIEIDMLSRLRSPAEQKQTREKLAAGKIDIVIGTHRLLQRDIRFKNLGLLIIDEEQRFGVAHKEKLKRFRADVDVLTLTATPIPRTLQLGLLGLRDLSVIDTPPVDRLAIRTYVTRFEDELIRQVILRELQRGGQVFFVHNRVQSIQAMADFLKQLIPEARIAVGHGQMNERELEKVMLDFIEGKSNVLVCTTIIENGIDIPRANTMLVNRADRFGLAQLYQLRGRVGRSDRRAYAYLLIPGEGVLGHDARERLRILQEQTELGAGFRIASHDLELRGAGELLGGKQAGQVTAVGFEMYTELLQETIDELQGIERDDRIDPDLRLGVSAFLPEKYLSDPNQRLVFYRRLASAESAQAVYELADELRDRYGELPEAGLLLLEVMQLRVLLKQLRIEAAEYDGRRLVFAFHASTSVRPEEILVRLQQTEIPCNFSPDYRLTIDVGRLDARPLLQHAKKELHAFLQPC